MTSRSKQEKQFAVCVNNKGYEASLEAGKLYRVIPDPDASSHAYIRVIDESGEDYGYSVGRFFPLEVPQALEKALATTTTLPTEELVQVRTERGTRKKSKQALSKVSKRKTKPRTAHRL
jgi:hypothetical protein